MECTYFQAERDKLLMEIKKLACVPYVQNKKIHDAYSDKLKDLECQVSCNYLNIHFIEVCILIGSLIVRLLVLS